MKTKKKREERASLVAKARAISDTVKDGEVMTAEQNAEFDRIMGDADKLKKEIDRLEALDEVETDLGTRVQNRAGREGLSEDEAKGQIDKENRACTAYIRYGMAGVPEDLRAVARTRFSAAQSGESGVAGGFLVGHSFQKQMIEAQKTFGPMLDPGIFDVINSASGEPMSFVTDNDTNNEGTIVGDNVQVGDQDVEVGQITLDGYTITSKIVKVPFALLQDSMIDIDAYLAKKFGIRLGRGKNRYLTAGDGAKKPTGIVNASSLGVTAAAATVIAPDEVIDLEHSVDPSYRQNGRYMFHDDILKHLRKKKDGQGRYLWQEGLKAGAPDTINNKPYLINQHMGSNATGQKAMLFGDFSSYTIRNIGNTRVLRLVERYADLNQVGFVAFERFDGNLLDAGTHPVKHLLMA